MENNNKKLEINDRIGSNNSYINFSDYIENEFKSDISKDYNNKDIDKLIINNDNNEYRTMPMAKPIDDSNSNDSKEIEDVGEYLVNGFSYNPDDESMSIDYISGATLKIKSNYTSPYNNYLEKVRKIFDQAKESGEILILGVTHNFIKKELLFKLSNNVELTVTDDEIVKSYTKIKEHENCTNSGGMDISGLGELFGALVGGNINIGQPISEDITNIDENNTAVETSIEDEIPKEE